jgi:phosphoglycolate phosphatase
MGGRIFKDMAEAFVFDFDGTLADTIGSIWEEYQRVISDMGLRRISHREFTREVGRSWNDIIGTFWPEADPAEFTRRYRQSAERMLPIEGANAALAKLSNGHVLAVMSSRGIRTLQPSIDQVGLDRRLFRAVYGRDDLTHNKPDPRALLQVCGDLCLEPCDAVYVGDSVIDARCALDAEAGFVAVLTGGAYPEDFRELGVADIIPSVADLPQLARTRRL